MVWLRCRTAICREEDWDDPVLAERKAEIRVAGDLKDELSVPAFVQQLVERQTPDGQAAENGWARGETQTLIALLTLQSDELNPANFPDLLFRDPDHGFGELLDDAIERLELARAGKLERRELGHKI
jgi:hypothetical protein